jgi:DNA-binding beta-propeller fold protein YncE
MKKLRFGFRALLKCLGMALLAGLPPLPVLAQSLAVVTNINNNTATQIDTSQSPPAVAATIPTTGPSAPCCSSGPEWVALTPGGRYAWVTNGGGNDNLVVIDMFNQIPVAVVKAETGTPPPSCGINPSPQCRAPQGIAINPCPALANAIPPCAARNGDTSGSIYAYVTNPPTNPPTPNGTIASVTVIDVNAALTYPSLSIVSTVLLPISPLSMPHHLSVSPDGSTLWVTDLTGVVWVIDTGLAVACAVTCPPTTVKPIHPNFGALGPGRIFGVAAVDATHAWISVDRPSPQTSEVTFLFPPPGSNSGGGFDGTPEDVALAPGGTDIWAAILDASPAPPTTDSGVFSFRQFPDGSVGVTEWYIPGSALLQWLSNRMTAAWC